MLILTILLWLFGSLAVLIFLGYLYTRWNKNIFKRLGIPGPEPGLFGITANIMKEGLAYADQNIMKKYGRVVGVFHGSLPSLMITDPNMIKQIYVKDFSNFVNREKYGPMPKIVMDCISEVDDDQWKHIRCVLNPTFSTGKLKQMLTLIDKCTGLLVKNVEKHVEQKKSIELKHLMGCYTLDVIANTGFSIDLDSQNNTDDTFVTYCKKAMTLSYPIIYAVAMLFPFTKNFLARFDYQLFGKDEDKAKFHSMIKQVIADRRSSPDEGQRDLLQLMLDAHKDKKTEDPDDDSGDEADSKFDFKYYKKRGLTDYEIFCNSNIFILAGYDTSSNCLTFALYLLATHPDVQERLYQEINNKIGKNKPGYYDVTKLQLLENVICETLRMYPPALRINRKAARDRTVCGYQIPAGMGCIVPLWAIHHDPELWPEPEKFSPDRFLPENRSEDHDYKWLPFGVGPRNCLGKRLGLLEVKEALVELLQNFRFVQAPDTEVPVKIEKGAFVRPQNPLYVGVERRD